MLKIFFSLNIIKVFIPHLSGSVTVDPERPISLHNDTCFNLSITIIKYFSTNRSGLRALSHELLKLLASCFRAFGKRP